MRSFGGGFGPDHTLLSSIENAQRGTIKDAGGIPEMEPIDETTMDDLKIMDLDGGYTPEFNETVKTMLLKKQRTRTMQ